MDTEEQTFPITEADHILVRSHQFLHSAKILQNSQAGRYRATFMRAPILHLVGHGVELLLKFQILASGVPGVDVRKAYGHDLRALWEADENKTMRRYTIEQAGVVWEEARLSNRYAGDFKQDPGEVLIAALFQLGYLHGRESDFALRYVAPAGTLAPWPAFLVDVFSEVADSLAKNTQLLTILSRMTV
jgi:hypothetical protein